MSPKSLTDQQLISLLAENKEEAFNELFDRYWKKLFSAAYKRVQSRESAEELVQDIFSSLWINRKKLVIHTSVESYFFTSVKYKSLRALQRTLRNASYTESVRIETPDSDHSTEQTIALHDLQASLDKEVAQLPDKCRTVFQMSRYKNYSTKEIAGLLGISEKTVENHIGKALKILRRKLKDHHFVTIFYFF